MQTRSPLPDPRAAARGLLGVVTLAAALTAAAPLATEPLKAQCSTIDPPCPAPPPREVGLWAEHTIDALGTLVPFSVSGISAGAYGVGKVSATVNGVSVPTSLSYDTYGQMASGTVTVTTANAGQANTLVVTYCDGLGCIGAQQTLYYNPPPPPPARAAPIVALEKNAGDRKSFAGCAGCMYGTIAYSTPSYRSLDQDRSLTFVYSSATARPLALVVLDATTNSTDAVAHMSVELYVTSGPNPSTARDLTTGGKRVVYAAGPGVNRLSAQFDASDLPTGVHSVRASVRNHYVAGGEAEAVFDFKLLVVNYAGSPLGAGWGVAGVKRLRAMTADVTIADGDGSIELFRSCGTYCWTSPLGDPSTLTLNQAAARFERRYPDGSVVWFDQTFLAS